jgi:hypothetical protein
MMSTSGLDAAAPSHQQRREPQPILVVVQRAWSDWRTAVVHVAELEEIHWFQPAGAARPLLHAYIWCDKIVSGNLSHDCLNSTSPHRLLICLLKSRTAPCVYEALAERAVVADRSGHSLSASAGY